MTPDEVAHLEFAQRAVDTCQAREIREARGRTRPQFQALAEGAFSVAALRAWEDGRRRPRGRQGAAYGRLLAESLGVLGAPR